MKMSDWVSDWNDKGARLMAIVIGTVLLPVAVTIALVLPQMMVDLKSFLKEVIH